jgi:hypothetical protein
MLLSQGDATTLTFDKRAYLTLSTVKGGEATRLAPAWDVLSPAYTRVTTVPGLYFSRAGRHGVASARSPVDSFPCATCQK